MNPASITFVINGSTFSLRADDLEAIAAIPAAERGQLIALLEAVKRHEAQAAAAAHAALDQAALDQAARVAPATVQAQASAPSPERLGSGDVDALMARLVMEENRNRKPGPTRQDMYRWLLGTGAIVALLILIF